MNITITGIGICFLIALVAGLAYASLLKTPPERPTWREVARATMWAGIWGCVFILAGTWPRIR